MPHPLARPASSGPVGILRPGQSLLVPTGPEDAETQGRRPPCALPSGWCPPQRLLGVLVGVVVLFACAQARYSVPEPRVCGRLRLRRLSEGSQVTSCYKGSTYLLTAPRVGRRKDMRLQNFRTHIHILHVRGRPLLGLPGGTKVHVTSFFRWQLQ